MTITSIIAKIYKDTGTNSTSYAAADMLIEINNALERIFSLILQADGRWQIDDTNNTDRPVGTTTLTSGQADYSLSSSHLLISKVEVKDENGNWYPLKPIDERDSKDESLSSLFAVNGKPQYYDKVGVSVILYPTPDYTQAASLKLYFQRGPALYTSAEVTTGTKEPGFSSIFHSLVPLWVTYNYWIGKKAEYATGFWNAIQIAEAQLTAHYSKRDKDDRQKITPARISHR